MEDTINGFLLENPDKVRRAIEGSQSTYATKFQKLADGYAPEVLLAAYDRLGGRITKDGVLVKTGSFWDFKNKVARKEPEVIFIAKVDGVEVEVEEEEAKEPVKVKF